MSAVLALGALAVPAAGHAALPQAVRDAVARHASVAAANSGVPECTAPAQPISVRTNQGEGFAVDCTNTVGSTLRVTTRPDHGHVDTYVDEGYLAYAAGTGYRGADSLTYVLHNEFGDSAPVTVAFDVRDGAPAGGSEPFCYYDNDVTAGGEGPDVRSTGSRSDPGGCYASNDDPLKPVVTSPPHHGDVTITDPGEYGQFQVVFAADPGIATATTDTATVTATDPVTGATVVRTLGWRIVPVSQNTAPSCSGGPTDPGLLWPIEVNTTDQLDNVYCTDPEDDPLTFAVVPGSGPTLGTVTSDPATGTVSYKAGALAGDDVFSFTMTDGHGGASDPTTTGVRVVPTQPTPSCTAPPVSTAMGAATSFTISCSGAERAYPISNVDGTWRTAQHGDLDIGVLKSGKVAITYHPDAGFSGADGFTMVDYNGFHTGADLPVAITVAAPSGGGPQTPSGPSAPAGPTAEQIKAAAQAYLARTVSPGIVKAILKALRSGVARTVAVKVGPFDRDVVIDLQVLFGPKGKASAAARRKKASKVVVGKGRLTLARARTGKLKLTLSRQGRNLLARRHRLKVSVMLSITNPATGARSKVTRTVTARAARVPKKHRR